MDEIEIMSLGRGRKAAYSLWALMLSIILLIAAAIIQVIIIRGQDGYTIFEGLAIIAIVVIGVALPLIYLILLIPFLKPSIGWARGEYTKCTRVAAIVIIIISAIFLPFVVLITYASLVDGYGILALAGIISISSMVHSSVRNVLFIIFLKGFRGMTCT